jgi:GntR family transcriptional regulator
MTVRRSLQLLVQHGFASVTAGKGYYVRDREIELRDNRLRGFTDEIRSLGRAPSSALVASRTIARDRIVGLPTEPQWGDSFRMIQRIRYGDRQPLAFETAYYDTATCGDLSDLVDEDSVYALLETRQHLRLSHAVQTVRATAITDDDAGFLDLEPGTPGLFIERTTYDDRDRPVEFVRATFRSDAYRIRMTLQTHGRHS